MKFKIKPLKAEFYYLILFVPLWIALYYRLHSPDGGISQNGKVILGLFALFCIVLCSMPWVSLFKQWRVARDAELTKADDIQVDDVFMGVVRGARILNHIAKYSYSVAGRTYQGNERLRREAYLHYLTIKIRDWHVVYNKSAPEESFLYENSYLETSDAK